MPTASALSKPEAPFDHEMQYCVFSAEGACAEAPLTSEPPLADAAPLTSETAVWDMDIDTGTDLGMDTGMDLGMDTGMDMDVDSTRP